jgi:hypothetical protein
VRGPMKLINSRYGLMECRVCGSRHFANVAFGRCARGSYQCTDDSCPSNDKEWNEATQRYLKPNWRTLLEDHHVA